MRRALLIATLALAAAAAPPAGAEDPPVVRYSCDPAPASCSGWFRRPVTARWDWSPATAVPIFGCTPDDPVDFDTASTIRYCEVRDLDGVTTRVGVPLKVDMTPPVVTGATASRVPDANGWYRSPLQVAFSGTDATSGLVGCTTATYGGPDSTSANVSGTCEDRAGNVSQASGFGLRYDATAPTVREVHAAPGDHVVRLDWEVTGAAAVELWRSPGLEGEPQSRLNTGTDGAAADRRVRNGHRYEYRLLAVDEAGNLALRTFSAVPGPRLLAPADGARVDGPPVLRWTAVRGAGYYNVQLYRGDRKLLSRWPTKPRLELTRAWRFEGERRRLQAGRRYRWLVWPGRGERSRNDYGPLIGRGTFTVAAS